VASRRKRPCIRRQILREPESSRRLCAQPEKTGEDYSRLPFIFGTVARKNKQYGSEVEEAMKRLAKEDKNTYLIDMSDAELMGDRLHFNQNSAEYLGKQMYEQIKKLR
jgi:hypothetical protein